MPPPVSPNVTWLLVKKSMFSALTPRTNTEMTTRASTPIARKAARTDMPSAT